MASGWAKGGIKIGTVMGCIAAAGVLLLLALCNATEVMMASSFDFESEEEFKAAEVAAMAGDAEAAFRLYEMYEFLEDDEVTEERWLKMAVDGGHEDAQYAYGQTYLQTDCVRSLDLLKIVEARTAIPQRKEHIRGLLAETTCPPVDASAGH